MAEKDKRYYWLKLKRDFFKRHDIQIIESMPNGKDYILFYLKLLCESVDHEGNLRFSEEIPYNEAMLAALTNTNIDIVRSAVKLFAELRMIDIMDDGTYYMNQVQKMIGSETYWAQKKREQRGKEIETPDVGLFPTQSNDSPTSPSKSLDKDKELELDKEEDKKNIYSSVISHIISHLNEKAETNYRATSKATKSHINARLSEGYAIEDFVAVIDKKCAEWKGTNMEKYLRPETLFGSKFEGYLNAPASTFVENGNIVIINDKKYEYRNGKYYIPNGNGVPVDPYADTSLF